LPSSAARYEEIAIGFEDVDAVGELDYYSMVSEKNYLDLPCPDPSDAWVINADKATITVDGDASDWASLSSDTVSMDLSLISVDNGDLAADYRMAWDDSYLYILIEEQAGDLLATEPVCVDCSDPNMNDGAGGEVYYDSLSLFFDFANDIKVPVGSASEIEAWLGIGLASAGQDDLIIAWTNGNWGPHDPGLVANAQYAASGTLGSRVVELAIAWADIDATVEAARLPAGGMAVNVAPGFTFGCDPRLNDLEKQWTQTATAGAAWLNGTLWGTAPSGNDTDSIDVKLVCSPSDLDNDCDVDLSDFAVLAQDWQDMDECDSLSAWCSGGDTDQSGSIVLSDLQDFAAYWLDN
jgi:hypothetical protein